MITPAVPDQKPPHRFRIPRRMGLVLGLLIVSVVHPLMVGVLPWALSLWTPRLGWSESGPATWHFLGLIPVTAGIVGLIWVFGVMFAQFPKLPETLELDEGEHPLTATSRVLITHAPFAYSRNPMFLAALTVWVGWALFYGSWPILTAAIIFWTLSDSLKVPQEERGLEARFGEPYRDYRARVPRWIGRIRRDRGSDPEAL